MDRDTIGHGITTIALAALGLNTTAALGGPDWVETGDAGSTTSTAQDTTSRGAIESVAGILGGEAEDDTEDVFRIEIRDRDTFENSISVGLRGQSAFDAALWLFDAQGFGVLANDDNPFSDGTEALLTAPSSDGVTLQLPPGNYFLAVTESGNLPLGFLSDFGRSGQGDELAPIFSFEGEREISGPDGPAGGSPLEAWSGAPTGQSGGYGIDVTPTPGTAATLGLAMAFASRRRR